MVGCATWPIRRPRFDEGVFPVPHCASNTVGFAILDKLEFVRGSSRDCHHALSSRLLLMATGSVLVSMVTIELIAGAVTGGSALAGRGVSGIDPFAAAGSTAMADGPLAALCLARDRLIQVPLWFSATPAPFTFVMHFAKPILESFTLSAIGRRVG